MNTSSFEQEIRGVFLEEAKEILNETESLILQIESAAEISVPVEKLFRNIHTLKGSAMVAGFEKLGKVAHAAESLMDALRSGRCGPEPAVIESLLAANDWMKKHVDGGSDNDQEDSDVVLNKIESAVTDIEPRVELRKKDLEPVDTLPPTPGVIRSGKRILVLDDERDLLAILCEQIADAGYVSIPASRGNEALEILKKEVVDVIVTDLKMPGMDGIEFVTRVRSFNKYIPIVVVSGHTSREHLKMFLTLGVDNFVEKPYSHEDILRALEMAVATRELRDSVLRLTSLSFRAYVTLSKILALYSVPGTGEEVERERLALAECMGAMREANISLLRNEQRRRRS